MALRDTWHRALQYFGLAHDETVDVEVTWPDGTTSTALDVPTRRRATLIRR